VKFSNQGSVHRLGVPSLNLALLHWPAAARLSACDPQNAELRLASWRALVQAQRQDLVWAPLAPNSRNLNRPVQVKSIGVSNFTPDHLHHIVKASSVVPTVNQIELHPLWQQQDTVECCASLGIAVQVACPVHSSNLQRHNLVGILLSSSRSALKSSGSYQR
jgi:diketogulonate reductase-like aldo/keto reductase